MKNIFNQLHLSADLKKKFDFIFLTQKAARNGRSIPPETQVDFS